MLSADWGNSVFFFFCQREEGELGIQRNAETMTGNDDQRGNDAG